ncbi:FtsW/RodA/SpoVE family cell cycle protein, partial [Acetobacter sp.]
MAGYSRTDDSPFGRWWRHVDRTTLVCTFILIGFGYILMLAASPAVAVRIGASRNMFIFKQVAFLTLAGLIVVSVSMLSRRAVLRLSLVGGALMLGATALTLVHGIEIKGARRWIALPMMSLQPSEFLKPCFAVVTGWLLAQRRVAGLIPGMLVSFALFGVIVLLLKSQPDIGMLTVITAVFLAQLFVNGLNLIFVGMGFAGMIGA